MFWEGWCVYYCDIPLYAPIRSGYHSVREYFNSIIQQWWDSRMTVVYHFALYTFCAYRINKAPVYKVVWCCEEFIIIPKKEGRLSLFIESLYKCGNCSRIFAQKYRSVSHNSVVLLNEHPFKTQANVLRVGGIINSLWIACFIWTIDGK